AWPGAPASAPRRWRGARRPRCPPTRRSPARTTWWSTRATCTSSRLRCRACGASSPGYVREPFGPDHGAVDGGVAHRAAQPLGGEGEELGQGRRGGLDRLEVDVAARE